MYNIVAIYIKVLSQIECVFFFNVHFFVKKKKKLEENFTLNLLVKLLYIYSRFMVFIEYCIYMKLYNGSLQIVCKPYFRQDVIQCYITSARYNIFIQYTYMIKCLSVYNIQIYINIYLYAQLAYI